jgi:predicted Rossmann fold flavoprotein
VLAPGPEPGGRFAELAGVSLPARLALWEAGGRRLVERTGSLLFTHFGLSGPAALDTSRHWLRARLERPGDIPVLTMGHPGFASPEAAQDWLRSQAAQNPRWTTVRLLGAILPQRLARLIAQWAAEGQPGRGAPVPGGQTSMKPVASLGREERRRLAVSLARLPLPVTGDRGYGQAEATAGGVDLREVDPRTLESRRWRGLYFCGEILDVDGRLGGFNFQWAWASGARAGRAAAGGGPP